MKKQILLLILLIFSLSVFCEPNNSTKQEQSTSTNTDNTPGLTEKQAYKMLYDNQVKANDSVLETIFYALGGLASAMILVFASNWWFNDKKVKDIIKEIDLKINTSKNETLSELTEKYNSFEIANTAIINQIHTKLQNDLNLQNSSLTEKIIEFNERNNDFVSKTNELINQIQTKFQNEINTSHSEITSKFTNFVEEIRAEIKTDNKELLLNYQKQLEGYTSNYSQQIATINNTLNSTAANLKDIINSKNENIIAQINSEKEATQLNINAIKSMIYRNQYWMWDGRGVHNNAFRAQMEELNVLIKNKAHDLEFYINQLIGTLAKLKYVHASDIVDVEKMISLVPIKNRSLMESALTKIKTIPVLGQ